MKNILKLLQKLDKNLVFLVNDFMNIPFSEVLQSISAAIKAFKKSFDEKRPAALSSNQIESGFSVLMKVGIGELFNPKASVEDTNQFKEICQRIAALPDEYKILIADSLRLTGNGPGMLERWAKHSGPHPIVMPEILKAFDRSIHFILNESEADKEFRIFYSLANRFSYATSKADAGTEWTRVDIPKEPVKEYNDEAIALKNKIQEQFVKIDERFIKLMNIRLREYRPMQFSTELAEIGHVNSAEEKQRITNLNEEIAAEARPYQSGETAVKDIIRLLNTEDFSKMRKLAGMLNYALNIYFETLPLATLKIDQSGELTSLRFPGHDDPAIH